MHTRWRPQQTEVGGTALTVLALLLGTLIPPDASWPQAPCLRSRASRQARPCSHCVASKVLTSSLRSRKPPSLLVSPEQAVTVTACWCQLMLDEFQLAPSSANLLDQTKVLSSSGPSVELYGLQIWGPGGHPYDWGVGCVMQIYFLLILHPKHGKW